MRARTQTWSSHKLKAVPSGQPGSSSIQVDKDEEREVESMGVPASATDTSDTPSLTPNLGNSELITIARKDDPAEFDKVHGAADGFVLAKENQEQISNQDSAPTPITI